MERKRLKCAFSLRPAYLWAQLNKEQDRTREWVCELEKEGEEKRTNRGEWQAVGRNFFCLEWISCTTTKIMRHILLLSGVLYCGSLLSIWEVGAGAREYFRGRGLLFSHIEIWHLNIYLRHLVTFYSLWKPKLDLAICVSLSGRRVLLWVGFWFGGSREPCSRIRFCKTFVML